MNQVTDNQTNEIGVFIGMQKGNRVHVRQLVFNPDIPLTLDLILASVVMRHRQVVKGLFNSTNRSDIAKAAKSMEIDGLFEISTSGCFPCHMDHIHECLAGEGLIFFLNQDGVWMMNGYCDTLSIDKPVPVVDVFKAYYKSYYPPEVLDFAFKDPKEPKRVYQVDEYDGVEDFLFEPLFLDSDIIEHVVVKTSPEDSNPKAA